MAPRFTFCIPNLNKIEFLPACIESMLAQNSDDWCCVFVDGFSTDGCWEYMQQFANDPRFRLLRGLKQGMYADWNECLRQVKTEYFYILTSDDTCHPNLVETVISCLDQYQHVDACHFKFDFINEEGDCIRTYDEFIKNQTRLYPEYLDTPHIRSGLLESSLQFLFRTYVTITSLAFRHCLIDKLVGFSSEFGPVGDIDWTARLCFNTDILYIPKTLATWRICDGQATQSNFNNAGALQEIAKANLSYLNERGNPLSSGEIKTYHQIFECLQKMYGYTLYKSLLEQQNLIQRLRMTLYCLSSLPFYPIWYLSMRFNSLFSSEDYFLKYRARIAREIIRRNSKLWPPQIVSFEISCKN